MYKDILEKLKSAAATGIIKLANFFETVTDKLLPFLSKQGAAAKDNKSRVALCAVALVLVLALIITVVCIAGGSGYKKPIDRFVGLRTGSVSESKIEKAMPAIAWQYVYDEYELDPEALVATYQEGSAAFAEKYGQKAAVKYSVASRKTMKGDDYSQLKRLLKTDFDIDMDDVKKAYCLKLNWQVKSDKKALSGEAENVIVVKVRSAWYLLSAMQDIP